MITYQHIFFFGRPSRFSWKSSWPTRNSSVFTGHVKVIFKLVMSDLATAFCLVAFMLWELQGTGGLLCGHCSSLPSSLASRSLFSF